MAGPAEHDKLAIVAELAAARARLSATGEALRRSLDVTARAKENFQRHKPAWLSGAAIFGFVLSKLPSRKRRSSSNRRRARCSARQENLARSFPPQNLR